MEDPEPSLGSILAVVSRDPALVQRLLNAASGTGYRGAPRTLDEAITRVGLDEVWRLGVQCAVHSVFLVPGYQDEVVRIRDRGLLAGEVAAWLVGRTRGPVYLAGVFSGVGDLLVVREAARSPRDKRPRRAFVSAVRGALAVHMSLLAAHEWRLWEGCAVALGHRLDPLRAPARHRPAALAVACAAACVARSEDESAPRPPIDAWLEALLGEEGLAQAAVLEQVRVARVRLGLSIRDYQAGRFGR